MEEFDFGALGLSLTERETRWEHGYEMRSELRNAENGEFIAWAATTAKVGLADQKIGTSGEFVQRSYLTLEQINVITAWLRQHAHAARWRLTTYTVMVEARS